MNGEAAADMCAGIIATRRQAAADAERRRGEDAEDVSSAHMAEPASEVGLPAPPALHLAVLPHLTEHASLTLLAVALMNSGVLVSAPHPVLLGMLP